LRGVVGLALVTMGDVANVDEGVVSRGLVDTTAGDSECGNVIVIGDAANGGEGD